MNEDAGTRRANLKRYCGPPRNWGPGDLARECQWGTYAYWRNLLEMDSKSFGEKVARRIETALHMPRGWLDTPREDAERPEDEPFSKLALGLAHLFDGLADVMDYTARKALYIELAAQINAARNRAILERTPEAVTIPVPRRGSGKQHA